MLVPIYMKRAQIENNGRSLQSKALFLPEGEKTVHNLMNFGNFLWGAAGYTLGYEAIVLQAGAHFNSLFNPRANGYLPQFDSKDDQLSIRLGVNFAKKNKFSRCKISTITSSYF